jgi:hypothetical protein
MRELPEDNLAGTEAGIWREREGTRLLFGRSREPRSRRRTRSQTMNYY